MKSRIFNNLFTFIIAASTCYGVQAAEPTDYYKNCIGKCGADLLSALCETIGPHTTVSYSGL